MREREPRILPADEARLSSLKRTTSDSRSLFDTFLMHSDHLLRFTDDLMRRANEIHFPPAPTISVTERPAPASPKVAKKKPEHAKSRSAAPRVPPIVHAPKAPPSTPRVLDLTDRPATAPQPPAPIVLAGRAAPIVVVIGPVDRMGEIENLTLDLEAVPEIDVHFRLFRAGAYRIDASCSDINSFTDRLRMRKDVLSVDRQGPMVHVLPAPVTL